MGYADAFFDIAGGGLFALVVAAILSDSSVRKTLRLSAVDLLIGMFAIWCLTIYVVYYEEADFAHVVKMLIPLFSYTVVKNVVRERAQYAKLLLWMIVGFSIPVIASAGLIVAGKGVDYVSYWTGIPRWQGVYTASHNFGHSMTLFLIVLVVYVEMVREGAATTGFGWPKKMLLASLAGIALYCLYKSQVRSAIVGLVIFIGMYLYAYNKKLLLVGAATVTVIALVLLPYWMPVLLPDVWLIEIGRDHSLMGLGSGRPRFWIGDLKQFAALPIDQLLAGVGIGRNYQQQDLELMGHSDWLEILTNTGIIGFILFAALQVFMLRAILKMERRDKFIFLAMFCAVNVMMLVSNSYVWRIQVSHLYYMALAFVEVRRPRMIPVDQSDGSTEVNEGYKGELSLGTQQQPVTKSPQNVFSGKRINNL